MSRWLYNTVDEALSAIDEAEQDVAADMGEEVLDQGGWVEVTRAVVDYDTAPSVRAEVLRIKGLDGWFG